MKVREVLTAALLAAVFVFATDRWVEPAWAALGGWSSSFEATPADSENISLGAGRIRTFKQETRARGDVEHDWGTLTGGNSDTGLHREGSAVAFFEDTEPTALNDPASTSLSASTGNRLWVDSNDSNRLYVYDDSATAFEQVTGNASFPAPHQDYNSTTATQTLNANPSSQAVSNITADITVPNDDFSYYIRVSYRINVGKAADDDTGTSEWHLEENCNAAGYSVVSEVVTEAYRGTDTTDLVMVVNDAYMNESPTAGHNCLYRVRVTELDSQFSSWTINDTSEGTPTSWMMAEVLLK